MNVDHLSNGLRSLHEYKVFVRSGEISRHDVIHASLFRCDYHDQYIRVQNSGRLPAIAGTLATLAGDFSPKK